MNDLSQDQGENRAIPLSVRLRVSAGFRVPAQYRDWVASEINEPGWPLRVSASRALLFLCPMMTLFFAFVYVVGDSTYGIAGPLISIWLSGLITSMIIGLVWPDWLRRGALKYQLKQ